MSDSEGNIKPYDQWVKDTASINSHYNKAWLRTEYDTAVLRAQMAADWKQFDKDKDVLPNLKWMPTTSVTPREEHKVFWSQGLTLPIGDKFWDNHRPGDQWNCKCWLEQTDEQATDKKDLPKESELPQPKAGLKGNPAKTKEIFSQDQPHFPKTCATCLINLDGLVHGLSKQVKNADVKKGNCTICDVAKSCIARIAKEGDRSVPPKFDTYVEHTEGGNGVFSSPKHGDSETEGNIEMAHKLAKHFGTNVFLLPRIDPSSPNAEQMFKELMPKGYPFKKEGKSPDYYINEDFYEAKRSINIEYTEIEDEQKNKIENRIKKGKSQADNVIIELPEWVYPRAIYRATNSYFKHTSHVRSFVIIMRDKVLEYKNPYLQKK